jgi:NAD(P)-dependent dehydrogenase (short-subunit alcohol dehydrogenase family)
VSGGAASPFALRTGLRVLVTAAASGIGRVIAELLLAHGARLHICDVSQQHIDDFTAANPGACCSKADVSSEAEVERLFADLSVSLGGLDVLVNNAGIAGPTGRVEDIAPLDWRRTLDVVLTSQFLCAHHAVPLLKAAGGGAIVNMSSAAGRYGWALRTPYVAAKWGVMGFTQSLAKELGPSNIRVNAILPGFVDGPRMESVIAARAKQTGVTYETAQQALLEKASLRRMVSAGDVAAMILFLLSDAGRNISGQSIGVDGNVETL